MTAILDFFMTNYAWFLAGILIILLAIIGRYADKTNFGQGNQDSKNGEDNLKTEDKLLDKKPENLISSQETNTVDNVQDNIEPIIINNNNDNIEGNNDNALKNTSVENVVSQDLENRQEKLEESFQKLDKEFDQVIPKKELIDNSLLDDIDSLSLDKTQKIDISDIPDLDDVELPDISKMKSDDGDIWKF